MDKELRIAITPGTILTILTIGLGAYVLWLLKGLVLLVVTAIVIASAIEPGVVFFTRHRVPRFVSVLGMYIGVFGSVFALIFFFLPPIITDAAAFLSSIPQYLNAITIPASFQGIASATDFLDSNSQLQSTLQVLTGLQSAFSTGSGGIVSLLAAFFGGVFSLVLVIMLSFYFALQETGVDDFLRLVVPARHEDYAIDLWKRAQKKIGLWMQGQLLLSLIMGILVYLGLLIIGVPYALLLAVITAFAEIIPVFGSLVAGAAAVVVGFSDGGVAIALIVLGLFVVANQFESNLIYPLIVKKVVGIPPLLVILALIAGGTLAGFLGILLSVPIAAVLLEFLTDYDKRKRRQESPS